MHTTGAPSRYPKMNLPAWPGTVETGKPGMSEYGSSQTTSRASAKPPRPLPSTSAAFGTKSVTLRT